MAIPAACFQRFCRSASVNAIDMTDSVVQAHARPSPLAPRPFSETATRRNFEYQSVTDYLGTAKPQADRLRLFVGRVRLG
jgi:hypothetical protein